MITVYKHKDVCCKCGSNLANLHPYTIRGKKFCIMCLPHDNELNEPHENPKTDKEILIEALEKMGVKYEPIISRDRGTVLVVFSERRSLDFLFDKAGKYIP